MASRIWNWILVISSFFSVRYRDRKHMRYALLVRLFLVSTKLSSSSTDSIKSPPISLINPNRSLELYSGVIHIEMSLRQTGYLLNYLNYVILPASNWSKNLLSCDQNNRTSGILNNRIANRSSPKPAAHPLSLPRPLRSRTPWWITPQPSISTHLPSKKTYSSKDGSVNGKYALTQRISVSPNRYFANFYKVCFKSFSASSTLTLSWLPSMLTASIWWKTG